MRYYKKRIRYVKKMRWAALLSVALVLLSGCTRKEELLLLEEETFSEEEILPEALEDPGETADDAGSGQEEQGVIYIHVCGAVACPGVYELRAGSRVYEAVQAAGGFLDSAEKNYVNQAQILEDGVKLVIPTIEEVSAAREGEPSSAASEGGGAAVTAGIVEGKLSQGGEGQAGPENGRININTASEAELCGIPGIGATRAAAIAAYRETHGGFQKPEDIMKVSGIKEGMYEKIKDSISVD